MNLRPLNQKQNRCCPLTNKEIELVSTTNKASTAIINNIYTMNPLLSFWIKVQPLSGSLGSHTWKAISQTSALAPTSGDDNVVVQHSTSSTWAFDIIKGAADRLLSHIKLSSSSWLLNPMISRMQDAAAPSSPSVAPIYKPSILSNNKAICEAGRSFL